MIKLYPISRTNEQAIMNLYFIFNKNLYEQIPKTIDNVDTYSYWKTMTTLNYKAISATV